MITTLQKRNFKAYLVGGCIRDLLLGKKPKDFDVSTDATPEQVYRLFGNSRIIGRRFRIVHVVFGHDTIIEVTTFRSNNIEAKTAKNVPARASVTTRVSAQSGMLLRDNVYGKSIVEDSLRRDFSINALYLDPVAKVIYDYNAGFYDLEKRQIDIIGDAKTRYSEDPVRMLRALRFSAKLGFSISKRTSDPIKRMSNLLTQVSNARMFEEVNKLFITGHGLESFRILKKYHILEILFPDLKEHLDNQNVIDFIEYALDSSDKRYANQKRNMPHFLYAVMLWRVFQNILFNLRRMNLSLVTTINADAIISKALKAVFTNQSTITDIPIAVMDSIRSLWRMQLVLQQPVQEKADFIASKVIFRAAYDFFVLRSRFEPQLKPLVDFWTPYYESSAALAEQRKAQKQQLLASRKKKKKKNEPVFKTPATEGFEDEGNLSAKRREQLEKARAWRASMNLKN